MATESKYLNSIPLNHQVQSRPGIPSDYHCTCEYCKNFMGEIYNMDQDKYYSNRIRKNYYLDKAGEHLDVGQVIGYKWAIQNLCPKDGYVLDPTAGTGTAIVESIINGRNALGVELEYPNIGELNIRHAIELMKDKINQKFYFRQGDARKIDEYIEEWGFDKPFLDLIINGTPYPKLSGKSSDAPERKNLKTRDDKSFDYTHEKNIGLTKGEEYWNLVNTVYSKSIKYLKPGGYFVILIKDLVQDKKPYLLHKYIIDVVLENNPDMEHYGFFLHKHCPTTLFLNTYVKRFPNIPIPLYQTGVVLRKKGYDLMDFGYNREVERNIREIIPEIIEKKSSVEKKNKKEKKIEEIKTSNNDENKKDEWQEGYKVGYQGGYSDCLYNMESYINELRKNNLNDN